MRLIKFKIEKYYTNLTYKVNVSEFKKTFSDLIIRIDFLEKKVTKVNSIIDIFTNERYLTIMFGTDRLNDVRLYRYDKTHSILIFRPFENLENIIDFKVLNGNYDNSKTNLECFDIFYNRIIEAFQILSKY